MDDDTEDVWEEMPPWAACWKRITSIAQIRAMHALTGSIFHFIVEMRKQTATDAQADGRILGAKASRISSDLPVDVQPGDSILLTFSPHSLGLGGWGGEIVGTCEQYLESFVLTPNRKASPNWTGQFLKTLIKSY